MKIEDKEKEAIEEEENGNPHYWGIDLKNEREAGKFVCVVSGYFNADEYSAIRAEYTKGSDEVMFICYGGWTNADDKVVGSYNLATKELNYKKGYGDEQDIWRFISVIEALAEKIGEQK